MTTTKPDSLSDGEGGAAKLTFEPHNGYGRKDPDGEPWPFGYISEGDGLPMPVFELTPLFQRPYEELLAFARLFAAAPDLLEALKGFNVKEGDIISGSADALVIRVPIAVIQAAAAAIAKAEAASPNLEGK
jgi:hypothetical protein